MKALYVAVVRAVRHALGALGIIARLDRWAARSTWGRWARSLLAIYDLDDLVALDTPWWTFASAELVDDFLRTRPRARVFEWGSGASSLWLAARADEVVSVEHDPAWADHVRALARSTNRIVTVPSVPSDEPVVASRKKGFAGRDFDDYVHAIDHEVGVFDLIVVDGRAREACFAVALRRLAPDGLLVFDNVDRARYRQAISHCADDVSVTWTRGLTPCLPYPTRTALVSLRHDA